jgi:two-component system, cell cycle sensor histidine kinase and response regulator CckA
VVALLKHSISKSIRIRQILSANPSTTKGDPSQLQNAVLNLSLNARDAMPDGGELTIETTNVIVTDEPLSNLVFPIPPGTYVRIGVADTGCGIEPSVLGRIFEPFFTTKPEGRGTGMGLAAVYGSVRNHHGGIALRSERGRGTTFSLYLPSCPEDATALAPIHSEDHAAMLAGRHVLFVDDEPSLRKLAVDMLAPMGCRISVCADGQEAVEFYQRSQGDIDVVVLDLVMPKIDGKTTFRQLKQIDPAIKVLLLSGFSIDGDAQQLLKEGALGFLQKPFQKSELVAKLAGVWRGSEPANP